MNERGKELTDSEKDQWSSFRLSSVVSTNIPNGRFKTCDEYVRIIKVGEGAKRYKGITLRSRQRSTDVERRNSENAHTPSKKILLLSPIVLILFNFDEINCPNGLFLGETQPQKCL